MSTAKSIFNLGYFTWREQQGVTITISKSAGISGSGAISSQDPDLGSLIEDFKRGGRRRARPRRHGGDRRQVDRQSQLSRACARVLRPRNEACADKVVSLEGSDLVRARRGFSRDGGRTCRAPQGMIWGADRAGSKRLTCRADRRQRRRPAVGQRAPATHRDELELARESCGASRKCCATSGAGKAAFYGRVSHMAMGCDFDAGAEGFR